MIESDFDSFAAIVGGFAELKGRTLSPDAIRLYWRAMQGWDLADFKQAAEHLLRTCAFMPTPKDFEDLRKASRMRPAEAWEQVLQAVRSGAYERGGVIVSALADRAVACIGGYRVVAMSEVDRTHFLERRFLEVYGQLEDAEIVRTELPRLAGPSNVARLGGRR